MLDLYGVYTLLFGIEESEFSRGLTDEWRAKLKDRLDKVKREHTAVRPFLSFSTIFYRKEMLERILS